MESASSLRLHARQWPGKAGTVQCWIHRAGTMPRPRPPRSRKAFWRQRNTAIWISRARHVSASNIRSIRLPSVYAITSSRMPTAPVPAMASIRAKASRTERAICSCVPPERISKSFSVPARTNSFGGSVSGSKRTSAGQKRRRSGPSSFSGQQPRTPWSQARSGSLPNKHPRRPALRLQHRRHECVWKCRALSDPRKCAASPCWRVQRSNALSSARGAASRGCPAPTGMGLRGAQLVGEYPREFHCCSTRLIAVHHARSFAFVARHGTSESRTYFRRILSAAFRYASRNPKKERPPAGFGCSPALRCFSPAAVQRLRASITFGGAFWYRKPCLCRDFTKSSRCR